MKNTNIPSARIKEIHTKMQGFVDDGKIAGINTLFAHHSEIVDFSCFGYLDLEQKIPLQTNSLFRIWSLTKPITATAFMMLVDEGLVALNDPVEKFIPEFEHMQVYQEDGNWTDALEPITMWHLLTHTSGLGYGFQEHPIEDLLRETRVVVGDTWVQQVPLCELVRKVAGIPLAFSPGKSWRYSYAADVIACLVEVISGTRFDNFLKDRIFDPLGMVDTGYYVPESKVERFGPMYSAPSENRIQVVEGVENSPYRNPSVYPNGGIGLVSTMSDYFRFMKMLANDGKLDDTRLLKTESVNRMTTNQLIGEQFPIRFEWGAWTGVGFGLGMAVQVDAYPDEGSPSGVYGWLGLSGTYAWVYPQEDLIVLAMPQSFHYHEPAYAFRKMAYKVIVD